MHMYDVPNVSSSSMRRSFMPVRVVIHSSDVSTLRLRSSLVSLDWGTYPPMAVIAAFIPFIMRKNGF